MARVTWRGVPLDGRTANMMDEVAKNMGDYYVRPSQGSYNRGGVAASAGTHDGGGAVDVIVSDLSTSMRHKLVREMRRVGFAAWLRTPQQSNWPYHVHAIAVQPGGKHDQGVLSRGAAAQVVDYYDGRNGLASHAPDDGPRDFVGTTWEKYHRNHERDWFDMASEADLRKIVREEVHKQLGDMADAVWSHELGEDSQGRPVPAGRRLRNTHKYAHKLVDQGDDGDE